ncbi:hypothetical protein Q8F55_008397 [Vanrija albida]|uniref:FAD/NAD(P)-binding domain-containing protein n=1 Tax=Vanrija albida TaxID=181172 RepID=A0ABR3PW72_9TREE
MSEPPKNVVIIGASFAGHALANALATSLPTSYRVVLVEQNDFAIHLPALVRAVVVPGSERDKLTGRLTQGTVFPPGSRHRLICPAKVLALGDGTVTLDTEFEGSKTVPFERCVVATGASQAPPLRPAPGSTLEEYNALLRTVQADMGAADAILIVGGGAVGVEVAGELSHHYPGKKVTLVHSQPRLLLTSESTPRPKAAAHDFAYAPVPEWIGESLEAQLAARGVDVALGERVVFPSGDWKEGGWDGATGKLDRAHDIPLTSGRTVRADYIFASPGNRPNSALVSAVDGEAVTGAGHVVVDAEFRVVSDDAALARVYALGDVATQAGRKTAGLAVYESRHASKVIAAHVKAAEAGRVETARGYTPIDWRSIVVPLGDGTGDAVGAGVLDFKWFGMWAAPRWIIRWFAKDYFVRNFYSLFKGRDEYR